jgi:predicted PurR-regulated permease PerM
MIQDLLEPRDRRLVRTALILLVVALTLVVGGQLATIFYFFGDIVLTFFLAWLIAFVISPAVNWLIERIPGLPQAAATVLVYAVLVVVGLAILVAGAAALYSSIDQFIRSIPTIRRDLPTIVQPYQAWLDSFGFTQIDLLAQANSVLANLNTIAGSLVQPLQQVAVASVGILGTLLITFFLSVWMVLDRAQIVAFLFRLVPPAWAEEARLLQNAVSRSFGGFLRGQAIMGITNFLVALTPHLLFGLPLGALSATTAGVLHAIPFFGPFVSWVPPVLVALVFEPDALPLTGAIMLVGWFVSMNILQPRIMQGAVGIHPIVVLGSVLVGSKVAGIAGAIFGIPIAAVVSAFFFHFLNLSSAERTVASRAARRLERRGGRPVRVPREPDPGLDRDIDDAVRPPGATGASPAAASPGLAASDPTLGVAAADPTLVAAADPTPGTPPPAAPPTAADGRAGSAP